MAAKARRPIVGGNWKMYGSRERVARFCEQLKQTPLPDDVEMLLLPPIGYLADFAAAVVGSPVQLGGQDLHVETEGAYTGEISGSMIKDLGGRWVLVGHSERRLHGGESNELVAEKFVVALDAGLSPILCVGESLSDREAGLAEAVVSRQLDAVLNRVGAANLGRGAVAYEPVWAIGTGRTATPEQAERMHAFIRAVIAGKSEAVSASVRVLYGGSVKPDNAMELFNQGNIDGGLIGGASLEPSSFLEIVAAGSRSMAVNRETT